MSDFLLPDLGEGLTEATIVAWHVKVGDEVTRNQALAEVETAKALVELPSPRAGRITALHAEEGQTLDVGSPLVGFAEAGAEPEPGAGGNAADGSVADEPAGASAADGSADGPAVDGAVTSGSVAEEPAAVPVGVGASVDGSDEATVSAEPAARPQRQQVLVGYGPVLPGTGRPRRRPRSYATTPYARPAGPTGEGPTPRAMPPVRRRARDLGVDLRSVHGSGPGGRILRADVEARAQGLPGSVTRASGTHTIPVTGLRKQTAQAMSASAFTAPHASVHVTIDVTDTLELLGRGSRESGRTSFLASVCRAILPAAARTPAANARYDAEAGQIEMFDQVRLGIAVATDRGLLVATLPEIDADGHQDPSGPALTAAIAETAQKARDGALTPAEVTGSTLTVTNVGVFDVDGGTPILNPGQSTILAIGALRRQPWEHRDEIALRTVVTLTLSFDHRVLDGAEASAFLTDIAETLADPATLLVR
ncbi:dihydrolipoamide acetyltransferase family protein [Brachybacterium paraconglomeratum]|uniref:dihydrolipoamide acetyltransferase family protein n=1 Tax=Brachybacterium paraconglomeratum TaxID=173362 RepID=UPI00223BF172|nr:dihydrolipoamide acetyltransferase family protein [Brachybacterium paraconglomeratum]MCT1435854.1 2-oxo acid dehydrogenase subunit E2 [Brachybacterium paraconglomeratum]